MEETLKKILEILSKEPSFLDNLTAYLTLASLLSSLVVAAIAIYGLKQIRFAAAQLKQSKKIAETQAQREAIKEATRLCEKFEKEVIPLSNSFNKKKWARLTKLQNVKFISFSPPQFDESNAEGWNEQAKPCIEDILCILNKMESFAIPFVAQIADENVAFLPVSKTYRSIAIRLFPILIDYNRKFRHYANTLTLLQRWEKKNTNLDLEIKKKITEEEINNLDTKIEESKVGKMNPIGTNL